MSPSPSSQAQQRKRDAASPRRVMQVPDKAYVLPKAQHQSPASHARGSGQASGPQGQSSKAAPLPASLKARMESSFGADLSSVTLHTGPQADAACQKRGAIAFCQGENIYLSQQAGPLSSPECVEVIAHELTHVVQQRGGSPEGGEQAQAPGAKTKPEDLKKGGAAKQAGAPQKGPKGGAALEGEAHAAAKKASAGEKVHVQGKAKAGEAQNLDDKGQKAAPQADSDNVNAFYIPLPHGQRIKVAIPPRNAKNKGDFAVGLDSLHDIVPAIPAAEASWGTSVKIPTPCYGLNLELGIDAGLKAEVKPLSFKEITFSRQGGVFKYEAKLATSLELAAEVGLRAGLNVDAWIAEVGAGLKAKAILSYLTEITAPVSISWQQGQTPVFSASLEMAAKDIEAKFQGAAYVYYDAWGISTFEKEWPLYERTLGKLSLAKVKLGYSSSKAGFDNKPEGPKLQNFAGQVSEIYPAKS